MSWGLIHWIRSFTYNADGSIIKNADGPVFAAHPQPNLWDLITSTAPTLGSNFDFVQFPPWCNGSGEGYTPSQHRNLSSNWGTLQALIEAIKACYAAGLRISPDLPFRQMNGENGGPGVFNYADNVWNLTAACFQNFDQPGEHTPPFQAKDSVIDPTGNYPFGRVLSLQHSPDGYVMNDLISILEYFVTTLGLIPKYTLPRWDDMKGQNGACVLKIIKTQPEMSFMGEVDTGNQQELQWVANDVMEGNSVLEDYADYWNRQRACNGYDATQFDANGGGLWQINPSKAAIFPNNQDVATTWSTTGGISQQTAFNLLIAYAQGCCLPCERFLVYAEDYFPASPNFPTGRGFMSFINNMMWFARKFAFGNFRRVWVDKDVYAYYRDGDGGPIGWSGGCLVVTNFNTSNARTITVQTPWQEGQSVHNYSITGHNEYYTVGISGMLTVTVKSNYFSGGQSYLLIAPSGVSGSIPHPPIAA